jgi:hypothetical protein
MITLVEATVNGKTPPSRKLTQDQVIQRSLKCKAIHLSERIERLEKQPQSGDSLHRAKQNLANIKESLSKL